MIAHAATIAAVLAEAGLPDGAIAHWFGTARAELAGLSPHAALEISPAAQSTVLKLARDDMADLRADTAGSRS